MDGALGEQFIRRFADLLEGFNTMQPYKDLMNTDNPTTIREKALAINLDQQFMGLLPRSVGSRGARNFFAGAAGGTIAKSMSAYDMVFSDNIYGSEEGGRYVSESRCENVDHEYNLLEERLVQRIQRPSFCFCQYGNHTKLLEEQASWVDGCTLSTRADSPPSDIICMSAYMTTTRYFNNVC